MMKAMAIRCFLCSILIISSSYAADYLSIKVRDRFTNETVYEAEKLHLPEGQKQIRQYKIIKPQQEQQTQISHIGASCHKAMIQKPQTFLGNYGEIVVLSDGSFWKNISYRYLYLYAYNPTVVICPGEGKMALDDKVFDVVKMRSLSDK
jgi:hypothetical protein